MLRKSKHTVVGGFAMLLTLIACGGGGGGDGSIVPPADDPTCPFVAPSTTVAKPLDNRSELQGPNITVPETTVSRLADSGVRAHTNHLIYNGPSRSRGAGGPSGLIPTDLYTAYSIPPDLGGGAIAIVDAYHYPTALADFNVFCNQFSLPQESSSDPLASSNTVLQVVYASGTKPPDDAGWSQEMALDIQWAHAMAPNAKIYLVEAASDLVSDLMAAVNIAKNLPGVKQVSLSFGADESACNFVRYDGNLVKSGVTFFAASGDASDDRLFPSLSKNAISCGGTTLNIDAFGNRISENSWSKSGAGLSQYEPRPVFQNVVVNSVQRYRGGVDVAAVGDPATGVSVFDSTPYNGQSGWLVFGGTSVSAPVLAGIANAAGSNHSSSQALNASLYAQLGLDTMYDVKHGTSGSHSAGTGWDFLSGVGSPRGLSGF